MDLLRLLPGLPADREVQQTYTSELLGSECSSMSLNAVVSNSELNLISGSNTISWGIWSFADFGNLSAVQAVVDVPQGESVYLAVADYSSGRWELDGPLSTGKSLPLDEVRHRSPAGNFHVAAISCGGDTAKIYKFVLHSESDWLLVNLVETWGVRDTSLMNVGGNPAASWTSPMNLAVQYVRATDPTGAEWAAVDNVVTDFDGIASSSMALVGNRPAICYAKSSGMSLPSSSLKFIRAKDNHGNLWESATEIMNTGSSYMNGISLAIVAGNPAVTCIRHNGSTDELVFARADDATGGSWSSNSVIDVFSGELMGSKLVLRLGYPFVGYSNATYGHVMMTGSPSTEGGSWWVPSPVVTGLGTPTAPFAAGELVQGALAFVYCDGPAASIRFAAYDQPSGEWEHYGIDTSSGIGESFSHPAMAVVNGKPAVCYFDIAEGSLKYAAASDENGFSWQVLQVVDHIGGSFTETALADINGKAAICYVVDEQIVRYAYNIGP